MNKNHSSDAKSFLSIRRILWMSLAISVGFHFILTLAFFFGESLFVTGPERGLERQQGPQWFEQGLPSDTLQISTMAPPPPRVLPPSERIGRNYKKFHFGRTLMHTTFSFILLLGLFLFNRRVMMMSFRKRWEELFFAILGSTINTVLLSLLFTYLPMWIDVRQPYPHFMTHIIRDSLIRDLSLMTIVIMACHLLRSLYRQKIIAVENEELKTENIRSRYEALKNQMDPHFMFNSLNTLQSLIETDMDEASDFVQQLSSVLRYTLQNKEVVTLADEMNCVKAYCNMMKIRFGDNLVFDFYIEPKYLNYKVLPLSIQGLIENAIKHNVISAKQPLVVHMATEKNDTLCVSNPIQPKLTEEMGNGTGLVNLSERYRLQWDKNVEIRNDGEHFVVTLPLIEK